MIAVGQYVDLNDGYGFQRVVHVTPHWFRLEGGGEIPQTDADRYEVRDNLDDQ